MIMGNKVRLRSIERDDLPRFVAWFNDPDIRRHLLMYLPMSLAQEERWFENMLGRLERQTDVLLAIETIDGVHIGNVGLHSIDWKNRNAEFAIAIGEKSHWGQGYGTDATRTILNLAFGGMNLHRVYLRVDTDNPRGIRCYEKVGFQREGIMRHVGFRKGVYHDQYLMSILESEFEINE
ncbi:MAG: GNAT family N-acetyltransferase [Chloroflexi bacterium]|nr:GNAT family N-acetyltransferase [Chloroflexota bacterium]